MNSQDVFYVGKIPTDHVELNEYFKNLSKVRQTHRLDRSDSDGISPLHPYYSRDYRSTKSEAREGPVFFQRSRCVFPSVSKVPGGFFKFMKNRDFSPRLGPKNRP